ncbi:MAG: 3-deoxy-manno-octulosonate cytidylyltransferase [Treponema sp.]|jgi:3-deoxy-manno-octulosonate cytidylyltransferase (CMP-KDO synthetase)|nr:3-deoxy-manno-octulosonate cytidylyltransferase [Treponema sp.]
MRIIGIIPARYASSRLPGKPLVDIHGKPMIWWVWKAAKQVVELDEVYIATDDERIRTIVEAFGGEVVMTSDCATGTDRVAEVSMKITADRYVVINGDEPTIKSEDIRAVALETSSGDKALIVLCFAVQEPIDVINPTIHKFALNERNEVIYISRSSIPFPQAEFEYDLHKCVGVYCYPRNLLKWFTQTPIGRLERIESSDLLRLVENRVPIKAVITKNQSFSVDTLKDLKRVTNILTPPPDIQYRSSQWLRYSCGASSFYKWRVA